MFAYNKIIAHVYKHLFLTYDRPYINTNVSYILSKKLLADKRKGKKMCSKIIKKMKNNQRNENKIKMCVNESKKIR